MRFFKLLLITLFVCFSFKAFPAVFIVTSNADSGPGTLREALTLAAANDSTQTDYIHFNFPDLTETGRTIILLTQLPDVSSNLVIDGSTQPGAKFGVSDAHVALFYQTAAGQALSGLAIDNKHDVEIYGLYIKNITDVSSVQTQYFWKAIELKNNKNIQIGSSGKGNVMSGFYYPLVVNFPNNEFEYFENLTLKDNIFGVDADGFTLSKNVTSAVAINFVVGQINIGGTVQEGNLFAQGLSINQDNHYDSTDPRDYYWSTPADIAIRNNNIGVDYLVQNAITTSSGLDIGTIDPGGKNTYHIEDNVIASPNNYAISEYNNGRPIYILRNYIGTDRTLKKSFKTGGISIYGATSLAIGSDNPADANYITNCKPVSIWPFSNVTVNKNSFYCTTGTQQMHDNGSFEFPFPVVNILKISVNSISGTATPNSNIELFYSDKCGTCAPQTYFASVNADDKGIWKYNGPINGSVIASATLGLNTSDFTVTAINSDSARIVNACGNGTGSITGLIPQSATNIQWLDIKGNIVGTNPDLLNVKIGKYKLLVKNGECADSTAYFEIKDKFQIDTTSIKKIQPSCNKPIGSISGINIINNDNEQPTTIWKDINGKTLSNSLILNAVSAGDYFLYIKSADSTCVQIYGPFALRSVSGPNIDPTHAIIKPANCGQSDGSITNLKITSSGPMMYSWINTSTRKEVATTSDLTNQPAGSYSLTVSNLDGTCPQLFGPILITNTGGPAIDDSNVILFQANCNNKGASITGIKATGVGNLTYTWTNRQGNIVGNNLDLTGIGAGLYTLTVTDQSQCGTSNSLPYQLIAQIGVAIDQTNLKVIQTSCASYGSVTGLVAYSPLNFVWRDDTGAVVATTPDLLNATGGTFILSVSDACGTKSTFTYDLGAKRPPLPVLNYSITSTCIGAASGSIIIQSAPSIKSYRWVDSRSATVGNGPSIGNLASGSYQLYVTDQNGCESFYKTYIIPEIPELQYVPGSAKVSTDQCSLKTGSIKYTQVTGGTEPYNYTWTNAAGQVISAASDVSGLRAGNYILTVTDASKCNLITEQFNIQDIENIIPAPSASNVSICNPGDAFLTVNDPSANYIYRLYDSENDAMPLDQQASGRFRINVQKNVTLYVSQVSGNCESSRTPVQIVIKGISSLNIANAITPNDDGINDYWRISGIENYPEALVHIFTRYGQKVFESRGYTHPFDGTINGKNLPVGVYYYIINLKNDCDLLTGNITIIR